MRVNRSLVLFFLVIAAGSCSVSGDGLRTSPPRPGASSALDAGGTPDVGCDASSRFPEADLEVVLRGDASLEALADAVAALDLTVVPRDPVDAVSPPGPEAEGPTPPPLGPEAGGEASSGPEPGQDSGGKAEAGHEVSPDRPREAANREAGRESGPEARPLEVLPSDVLPPDTRPACPAYCSGGCYLGCGPGGECRACATCTCSGETGICHC
jgi:hypothetical protein